MQPRCSSCACTRLRRGRRPTRQNPRARDAKSCRGCSRIVFLPFDHRFPPTSPFLLRLPQTRLLLLSFAVFLDLLSLVISMSMLYVLLSQYPIHILSLSFCLLAITYAQLDFDVSSSSLRDSSRSFVQLHGHDGQVRQVVSVSLPLQNVMLKASSFRF